MIPPNQHRVQISASLQGGELMVHNLFVKNVAPIGEAGLQVLADGVRDKWAASLAKVFPGGTLQSQLSQTTVYVKVAAYKLDPVTGRSIDLAEALFPGGFAGGAGACNPTELALCCTLETGKPGRSNRGRLYLGGFAKDTIEATNGRVRTDVTDTAAKAMADFLRQVRAIGVSTGQQDIYEPQVVSQKLTSARKITKVTVGNVWDVQRRRRNKLVELRAAADVG